ncbi:hypothetical protein CR513_44537, partial [Mucuna pruriens]
MPLQFMWRFIFKRLVMFFVTMGIRYGFEEKDLVSGGEFTSGRLGVHGKARHLFNLINLPILVRTYAPN